MSTKNISSRPVLCKKRKLVRCRTENERGNSNSCSGDEEAVNFNKPQTKHRKVLEYQTTVFDSDSDGAEEITADDCDVDNLLQALLLPKSPDDSDYDSSESDRNIDQVEEIEADDSDVASLLAGLLHPRCEIETEVRSGGDETDEIEASDTHSDVTSLLQTKDNGCPSFTYCQAFPSMHVRSRQRDAFVKANNGLDTHSALGRASGVHLEADRSCTSDGTPVVEPDESSVENHNLSTAHRCSSASTLTDEEMPNEIHELSATNCNTSPSCGFLFSRDEPEREAQDSRIKPHDSSYIQHLTSPLRPEKFSSENAEPSRIPTLQDNASNITLASHYQNLSTDPSPSVQIAVSPKQRSVSETFQNHIQRDAEDASGNRPRVPQTKDLNHNDGDTADGVRNGDGICKGHVVPDQTSATIQSSSTVITQQLKKSLIRVDSCGETEIGEKRLLQLKDQVSTSDDFEDIVNAYSRLREFFCSLCPFICNHLPKMDDHLKSHHSEVFAEVTVENTDKTIRDPSEKFRCLVAGCNFESSHFSDLLYHVTNPNKFCRRLRIDKEQQSLIKFAGIKRSSSRRSKLFCRFCSFCCESSLDLLNHDCSVIGSDVENTPCSRSTGYCSASDETTSEDILKTGDQKVINAPSAISNPGTYRRKSVANICDKTLEKGRHELKEFDVNFDVSLKVLRPLIVGTKCPHCDFKTDVSCLMVMHGIQHENKIAGPDCTEGFSSSKHSRLATNHQLKSRENDDRKRILSALNTVYAKFQSPTSVEEIQTDVTEFTLTCSHCPFETNLTSLLIIHENLCRGK